MDFRDAMLGALKICGKRAGDTHFFYSAMCDAVGNDLILKPQLEAFHHFNTKYHIVEAMSANPEPKTIGLLLEKCKEQPDAPVKLCLRWIHTLFEFYYQESHTKSEETERILRSVEKDYFEPEQEGIVLPKPKKERQKSPRKVPQKQVASSQKQANPAKRQTNPPAKVAKSPAKPAKSPQNPKIPQSKIVMASGMPGIAPHIKGLKPIAPFALPNAKYKELDDMAIVYQSGATPHLHVSCQCPGLQYATTIYKGKYSKARGKDFLRMYGFRDQKLAKHHIPPLCKTCGDFVPEIAGQVPKQTIKDLK